ncbi:DgyrCDS5804 [Dimorphilus gyrociliatus]|uniref:DgyrCDS5804 n=1 Tax=Dimorphilus gyrociliatus TaxID=2664684 RepID=A0A7I8VNC2_9ANNE|nr:DgyrCDS5804 [Dimorphilus gyrociliatus]
MTPKPKSNKAESVKVVVRCRPLNSKEESQGHVRIVDMDVKRGVIDIRNIAGAKNEAKKTFTFDSVYDWNSKQRDLYDETFRDLVQSVLDGFNGTIFAYGQTGTGKTFTMQGVKNDPEMRGIIPNSFEHIFQHIAISENQQYLVRASYLEIYQEEIRDLLAKDQGRRLELKERPDTGVYVKDLSSIVTKGVREIEHIMNVGDANRKVGSTNMNEHSSRSHAIFIITIECSEEGADGENHIRVGKLNLVDLAGSERQAKTGAEGERLKEATKINLSLSALGNVICALVDGKSSHIPYRDSKLTRLLQDSLGGNAKTVMVANIGPASYNYDESVTTLRYANRAKNIKNKPKINEDPKDALLREFQEEIARLKKQIEGKGGGAVVSGKKRRRRRRRGGDGGADGEFEDDDDEEDESVDPEKAAELYRQEQQQKLEEEKQAIMGDQSMIAEKKQKLLEELNNQETRLKKEQEAKQALQMKLKAMESKLLCGDVNIVDHTKEQQRALEQKRKEIADQKKQEREMQQKLEEKEETAINLQETFSSLQQEVEVKTKKLKKIFAKLQSTKQEIVDLQEEHARERQELERTQNELTRDLRMKMLIIENFIPIEEKQKIMQRAIFDEDEDSWRVTPFAEPGSMAKRPASAVGNRRPMSDYAKTQALKTANPRYKGENILLVELDMPTRTTRDYEGPTVAPRVQAAIDAALASDGDLDIDSPQRGPEVRKKGNVLKKKSAKISFESMPQGKLKTKIKKPCPTKQKSNLVKKKESLTKRGKRTIAPKKSRAVEAKKTEQAISKVINSRLHQEIRSQAETCEIKTLKQMKQKNEMETNVAVRVIQIRETNTDIDFDIKVTFGEENGTSVLRVIGPCNREPYGSAVASSSLKLTPEMEARVYVDFIGNRQTLIKQIHLIDTRGFESFRNFAHYLRQMVSHSYWYDDMKNTLLKRLEDDKFTSRHTLSRRCSTFSDNKSNRTSKNTSLDLDPPVTDDTDRERYKTCNGLQICITKGEILEQTTDAIIYGQTNPPYFGNGLAKSVKEILSDDIFKTYQNQLSILKVYDHIVTTLPNDVHIVHWVLPSTAIPEAKASKIENSLGDILLGMDQHNVICVSISILGTYLSWSLEEKYALARSIIYVLTSISQLKSLKYTILIDNDGQNVAILKKICQFWAEKGLLTNCNKVNPSEQDEREEVNLRDKIYDSNEQIVSLTCAQCLALRGDGSEQMKCGHYLCRECSKLSQYNPEANCKGSYSYQQPPGTMRHYFNKDINCSGYENKGTIIIEYIFPDGIQQNCHPNPGRTFVGCKYITFLPNNKDGLLALKLYQKAWEIGILFKIQSTSNDEVNYVTWNIIKQKTSLYGGPDKKIENDSGITETTSIYRELSTTDDDDNAGFSAAGRLVFAQINLQALTNNIKILRNKLQKPNAGIIGVVKAGAYGHGSVYISKHLKLIGVERLAVATVHEGIYLRRNNISGPIHVFGNLYESEALPCIEHNLIPTANSPNVIEAIGKARDELKSHPGKWLNLIKQGNDIEPGTINIKIDTGMSRNGCSPKDFATLLKICDESRVKIDGVFTHFSDSYANPDSARKELEVFMKVVNKHKHRNFHLHSSNSGAILHDIGTNLDFIRPGISMYGLSSDSDSDIIKPLGFRPILSLHARPNLVKVMQKGRFVGYGGTYECEEGDVIATISIGYADGYWRHLSNNVGKVNLKLLNQLCPVVGRVSMDAITVKIPRDILSVTKSHKFDVTIISPDYDKETSALAIAAKVNSISYEVATRLSCRIPRLYTESNSIENIVWSVQGCDRDIY